MKIRHGEARDCAAIAEIYNHAVKNTTAVWNEKTVDAENRAVWLGQRQLAGYPVLVAQDGERIVGYASFGDWRAFDGYRHTVEHSVYVHPQSQGKGLGRTLMQHLIGEAQKLGKHVMIAAIESQNAASIKLHEQLGFRITGQMPQVGAKFGRWLDLTFMQLQLDSRSEPDSRE
ncbi:GNAT family N-acetyltransferase [Entomohabitans teleogrylli]|uniref:GNAT family N-acetyltransferase n=1 Tax=Entomohabitans teleogrylli TaxID=1384589 RepID=UPI00073DA86F|nr:GNAT family N-acetyltransferase [Entomohabitans teleogrylli]